MQNISIVASNFELKLQKSIFCYMKKSEQLELTVILHRLGLTLFSRLVGGGKCVCNEIFAITDKSVELSNISLYNYTLNRFIMPTN